jgi:hypothetical protein
MNGANNYMHSDSKKRISSFFIALLFAAGDVRRVCRAWHEASWAQVPTPGVRRAEG